MRWILHRDGITPNMILLFLAPSLAVTGRRQCKRVVAGLRRAQHPPANPPRAVTPPTGPLQYSTYNFLIPLVLFLNRGSSHAALDRHLPRMHSRVYLPQSRDSAGSTPRSLRLAPQTRNGHRRHSAPLPPMQKNIPVPNRRSSLPRPRVSLCLRIDKQLLTLDYTPGCSFL
jgi:hypothetical protein